MTQALPQYLLRMSCGSGDGAIVYDLVKFETVAIGTKQAELRSVTKLPFPITLIVDLTGEKHGTIHFTENTLGFKPREVHKEAVAIQTLSQGSVLYLYDLEAGKPFLEVHTHFAPPDWLTQIAELADMAQQVATFYRADLVWPKSISDAELYILHRLYQLIFGIPLPLRELRFGATKTVQLSPAEITNSLRNQQLAFVHDPPATVTLFGSSIRPAPWRVVISNGRVQNRAKFADFLSRAPIGTSTSVHLKCPTGAMMFAIPRTEG